MASDLLKDRFEEIERLGHAAGLRPYDIHFFEVPVSLIYEVASYGLPTRYSHWSFGKVHLYQRMQGEMGFSKIYELIINNNPSYAFLDKSNTDTTNLLVCAHVVGHADFFRNNIMFRRCGEENMIQVAKRHAEIIDSYRKDYGDDEVDEWLDTALALERHIDIFRGVKRSRYPKRHIVYKERTPTKWEDVVEEQREPLVKKIIKGIHIPPHPEKDLLWFLSEYANLEPWQQNIFEIVRRESYYFYPQYRTRILNEGWACVSSDSKILTEQGLLRIDEYNSCKHEDSKCYNGEEFVNRSDTYITEEKDGLFILTNRGLSIKCASNHRFQIEDGRFVAAKDLKIDTSLRFISGINKWNEEIQFIECGYVPEKQASRDVNTIDRVVFDDKFAKFIAFWIGEGCTSKNRGIYIRNSDKPLLVKLGEYIKDTFNVNYAIHRVKDGGNERYNLEFYSRALFTLLKQICNGHKTSRQKRIPNLVFKSPKPVVVAFLRSLFDAEGCVYHKDCKAKHIIFTSSSLEMINDVAVLLSNFGIYGNFLYNKKDGYEDVYQIKIATSCLRLYSEQIGFDDPSKSKKLSEILSTCTFNNMSKLDTVKIIRIDKIRDIFYDFTVPDRHQYVANGMVHHNSYWHAELMKQYALGDENDYGVKDIKYPLSSEEHLDFLINHEKVVQPGMKMHLKIEVPECDSVGRPTGKTYKDWDSRIKANPSLFHKVTRLNPYYMGFRIFRDIKERWDEYFEQGFYENEWDDKIPVTINGNQKIREVMMEEDDVSFFRNYLTEKLCEDLHLFAYGNTDKYADDYGIQENIKKRIGDHGDKHLGELPIDDQLIENKTSIVRTKEMKDIVSFLARSLNNYGVPAIVVRRVDEAGLLRLEHIDDDLVNLDIDYAQFVLRYIGRAWGRPVELIRKTKKRTWIMSYDGVSFEVGHELPDYPENIESNQTPSSW